MKQPEFFELPIKPIPDVRALRKALKMNQSEFWSRVFVTQSGGSRYESGREMPMQVIACINMVYLTRHNKRAPAKIRPKTAMKKK